MNDSQRIVLDIEEKMETFIKEFSSKGEQKATNAHNRFLANCAMLHEYDMTIAELCESDLDEEELVEKLSEIEKSVNEICGNAKLTDTVL